VVKVLCYKSEGRWFDSRWSHWNFSLTQNPSGRTMALVSTKPLIEMSTRTFSGGKGGRCVRLTTLPPSWAVLLDSGNLNFVEPSGQTQACNGTDLPLPLQCKMCYTHFKYNIYIYIYSRVSKTGKTIKCNNKCTVIMTQNSELTTDNAGIAGISYIE